MQPSKEDIARAVATLGKLARVNGGNLAVVRSIMANADGFEPCIIAVGIGGVAIELSSMTDRLTGPGGATLTHEDTDVTPMPTATSDPKMN